MTKSGLPGAVRCRLVLLALILGAAWPTTAAPAAGSPGLGRPVLPGAAEPALVPEVFAPGLVSTEVGARDFALHPNGREFYFSRIAAGYAHAAILMSRFEAGAWTEPQVAVFSGGTEHLDLGPFISPDGQSLYFTSTRGRAADSAADGAADQNLWVVKRVANSWGPAQPLPATVNTAQAEFHPAVTATGTLYFTRSDSTGRTHAIWRAVSDGEGFATAERLPAAVNCGTSCFNATVAADERRLIVSVVGGPDNLGLVDYYLIQRSAADSWSAPLNLGALVNDGSVGGWASSLTPDGEEWMFMSARRLGQADEWPLSWGRLQADHRRVGGGSPVIMRLSAAYLDSLCRGGAWPGSGEAADLPAPAVPVFPNLSGDYLGQRPPGRVPELFAPGIISTGANERDIVFSREGDRIWYGVMKGDLVTVMETRRVDGRWREPVTAPFHRDPHFFCFEPALSADGRTLLLLSNAAAPGQDQGQRWDNQNLVRAVLNGDRWSEPTALPPPITTDAAEYFPSLAADGTLYFTREDSAGQAALWCAAPTGDDEGAPVYQTPVRLPSAVNVGTDNFNATVAADQSWLAYCVAGHPENLGVSDYWLAVRGPDGAWQPARNLGPLFNGPGWRAASLSLSPDGKYVFFASNRPGPSSFFPEGRITSAGLSAMHGQPGNGNLDIWWVAAEALGLE